MNDSLKTYLAKADHAKLDSTLVQAHIRVMTEKVIPEILKDIREAERVAAELRYAPAIRARASADGAARIAP